MPPVTSSAILTDPTRVGSKRVVAACIDLGIEALVLAVLFLVLAQDYERFSVVSGTYVQGRELQGFSAVVVYAFALGYNAGVFVLWRGLTGNTVGTLVMRIVVTDQEGQPPGPLRAIIRSVAGAVDYLPCCVPAVGLITIFTSGSHRRVGDLAAATWVVDRSVKGMPIEAGRATISARSAAADAERAAQGPQPEWDSHRNAFVQYDTTTSTWMAYDETKGEWQAAD